jgi:hypothetical protein
MRTGVISPLSFSTCYRLSLTEDKLSTVTCFVTLNLLVSVQLPRFLMFLYVSESYSQDGDGRDNLKLDFVNEYV